MSIVPIAVLPSSLLRKLFAKFVIYSSINCIIISATYVYRHFIKTMLNNLLQLDDYFLTKAASMRRDINDHKTPPVLLDWFAIVK